MLRGRRESEMREKLNLQYKKLMKLKYKTNQ